MADIPNTKLINFVDTPASLAYSKFGEATVPLATKSSGILDITGFRQVSIRIGSTSATKFRVFMGKISGTTLSVAYSKKVDSKIHTFNVVSPEMTLVLNGPANTKEDVQLWVYLRS